MALGLAVALCHCGTGLDNAPGSAASSSGSDAPRESPELSQLEPVAVREICPDWPRTALDDPTVREVVREQDLELEQVLARGTGEFVSTLRWPAEGDSISAAPESGDVPLTIRVSYEGGLATYVQGSGGPGLGCSDRVEVDVAVSIRTEGGALNERFDAVLAMGRRIGQIHYRTPSQSLNGSLSFTTSPSRDSNPVVIGPDIDFTLQVSELGTSGRLALTTADTTAVDRLLGFAAWPAGADCASNEVASPVDGSMGGVSPTRIGELVAGRRVPFTWADGSQADFFMSLLPSGRPGCASEDGDLFRWRFDADVSAATSDGVLDGPLAGWIQLVQNPDRVTASVEMRGALGSEPLSALLPRSTAAATNPYDGYVDFGVRHSFAWPSEQFLGSAGRLSVVVAPPPACDEEECDVRLILADGRIPAEAAAPP